MSADDEKPPLDAALRHLAEQQRRSLTSHPTPQELAAYHAGELPPEAESRLLDHLAICRDCSDLLLDLAGFADLKPPQGVPELTDEQVEQDWQALRAKMGKGEGKKERTAEVVPIRPAGLTSRPGRTYPMWLPVAASLLAVLGFSFGLYQSSRVRQPWSPVSVTLDGTSQRSAGGEELERMTSRDGAVLFLYFDADKTYPNYEVEIGDRATLEASHPREDGLPVYVVIEPNYLKRGEYEIRLYGVNGDRREEVEKYHLQVDGP